MAQKPKRGNFLTNAGYQKALARWNSSASTAKRTNKATSNLRETVSRAEGTSTRIKRGRFLTQAGFEKAVAKAKTKAQEKLGKQFKTKGAGKSIQSKLKEGGHTQASLDLKRAKHSLSKSDRAEMNRLRRGTTKERELYKKKKKEQRAQANRDALKAGSSSWD